jgi:hypothetical protein
MSSHLENGSTMYAFNTTKQRSTHSLAVTLPLWKLKGKRHFAIKMFAEKNPIESRKCSSENIVYMSGLFFLSSFPFLLWIK